MRPFPSPRTLLLFLTTIALGFFTTTSAQSAEAPPLTKWQKGKGWGWVWGPNDEVGSLNEMTDASRLAAMRLVKQGRTYDLGITYDRTSFKWPGHSPGEILSFRTPEGVKRQRDLPALVDQNSIQTAWHSCALFINDNVATQIDGLGHITAGADNHWYNGFKERDWGGNWGVRKCDATTIPPIVARGVLIDVAGYKNVPVLPPHTVITPDDLQGALRRQGTELQPGDVVLIRTGTLLYWGETGADEDGLIKQHDTAGIDLAAAKWLVEQHGSMLIGSDTSGLEYVPKPEDTAAYRAKYGTFIPVHHFLLIEQGVHIGEFHQLEELARDRVYEFCYFCPVNKVKGAVAGFALRPVAMR